MVNNWVLCDVISLDWWWERWETFSSYRNNPVLIHQTQMLPVADPGFSPGGCANSQNCYYFSNFCRKLHENEIIWSPRGGARPWCPPWIRQWLLAKIKWFISDVIPDSHLIRGKGNRTNNSQEWIFPSKLSESCVMSYIYIADNKGERFCLVAGVIQYFTGAFTKARLLLAKLSHLFVMYLQIIISLHENVTGLVINRNGFFYQNLQDYLPTGNASHGKSKRFCLLARMIQ